MVVFLVVSEGLILPQSGWGGKMYFTVNGMNLDKKY